MIPTKKILVVDDDEGVLEALSCCLGNSMVNIIKCSEITQAEYAVKNIFFDAVITDLFLTRVQNHEGFELLQYIRGNSPRTKVIIMTAFGSPRIEQEALKKGAFFYFDKPINLQVLKSKLQETGIYLFASSGQRKVNRQNEKVWTGLKELSNDPQETRPTAVNKSEIRICVIEDEEEIIGLVQSSLETLGYTTLGITNVIGSCNELRLFRPHIIVLDLGLPGINGQDLLDIYRQNLNFSPKIIIFSGLSQGDLEKMAMNMGADDFHCKDEGFLRLLGKINLLALQVKKAGNSCATVAESSARQGCDGRG